MSVVRCVPFRHPISFCQPSDASLRGALHLVTRPVAARDHISRTRPRGNARETLSSLCLRQTYTTPESCVGGAEREAGSIKILLTTHSPSPPESVLQSLSDSLAVLSPELIPIHERLVSCRRQLVALATKETALVAAKSEAFAESGDRAEVKVLCPDFQAAEADAEPESSKTPTKDSPNPEPPLRTKVKAELKPIQEELRKIDGLSAPLFPFSL